MKHTSQRDKSKKIFKGHIPLSERISCARMGDQAENSSVPRGICEGAHPNIIRMRAPWKRILVFVQKRSQAVHRLLDPAAACAACSPPISIGTLRRRRDDSGIGVVISRTPFSKRAFASSVFTPSGIGISRRNSP
jgi:hypothetical protein